MNGFLLDTNVISELIKPRPAASVAAWVDSNNEELFFLSVLTLGEIRKGIAALPGTARRAALDAWLENALRPRFAGRILPVDEAVADRWGLIAAVASSSGRPLPVIDGLLAATALERGLVLVTRNLADIAATGVAVFNPWEQPDG
jgi:predicted nucleic acid-binding protein